MLCWWAWTPCVVIPGTDWLVQDLVGSSAAAVVAAVVAAAERAACGGPGEGESVGAALDVVGLPEPGTELRAGEEAAWSETTAEIAPGQTAGEKSVLAVAAADEPVPGATAWTAGADGFAGTAAGITVLGCSRALYTLALHHPPAASGEAGKTASPGA